MATLDKFETETNLLVTKMNFLVKIHKNLAIRDKIRDRDESNQREDPNVVACRGFTILNRCEAKQNTGEPKRGTAKALEAPKQEGDESPSNLDDAVPPQIRKGTVYSLGDQSNNIDKSI